MFKYLPFYRNESKSKDANRHKWISRLLHYRLRIQCFQNKALFQRNVHLVQTLNQSCHVISFEPSVRLRSEEHTSELQSRGHLVCRLLLEKKKNQKKLILVIAD